MYSNNSTTIITLIMAKSELYEIRWNFWDRLTQTEKGIYIREALDGLLHAKHLIHATRLKPSIEYTTYVHKIDGLDKNNVYVSVRFLTNKCRFGFTRRQCRRCTFKVSRRIFKIDGQV
jgi:hypothetical protein